MLFEEKFLPLSFRKVTKNIINKITIMLQTKKTLLSLIVCALLAGTAHHSFAQSASIKRFKIDNAESTDLSKKLESIDVLSEVTRIVNNVPIFSEKYAVKIKQLINPNDESIGSFDQQIYICHAGYDRPTIIVTDGYTAGFALNPRYTEELSRRYKANIVAIQHRYFEQSTPESADWKYMRGDYAAADMHHITNIMKTLYKGKFVASGVSKGGQNTMIYATYYPNDMDFYVPYVGPVCFALEDTRHEGFLAKVGPKEDRKRIKNFQIEILKRRKKMIALLDAHSKKNNLTYKGVGLDEILDMCVLEYSFALWQNSCEKVSKIPSTNSSDEELFNHLIMINDPSYFANVSNTGPFYVQAAMELGYYSYNCKPLKKWLSVKNTDNYLKRIFMEDKFANLKFDDYLHQDIYKFLGENDPKMIFIYGEYDPWTAAAPEMSLFKNKENMKFYLCPKYDHKTRINNFPNDTKEEIWSILDKWMSR